MIDGGRPISGKVTRRRRCTIGWALRLGIPAVLVVGAASPAGAPPSAGSAEAGAGAPFPLNMTGKGDAAVRQLNQEELDRIVRQRL